MLEPIGDKINEAPTGLGSCFGFRSTKSKWFSTYRDFFLPSDSFDVIFLKDKIAISCAKGFKIMDLHKYWLSVFAIGFFFFDMSFLALRVSQFLNAKTRSMPSFPDDVNHPDL